MAANVILAPQLFSSLSSLSGNDQASVFSFIEKFRGDPTSAQHSLKRMTGGSANVWQAYVTAGSTAIRAILYKDGDTWAILYVGRHEAPDWAKRRNIGRHSITGGLQIVETVETIREVERVIEHYVEPEKPPLFESHEDSYLLSLGVPDNWLPTLRRARNDDHLMAVTEKLPDGVSDRLWSLAAGEFVTPPAPVAPEAPLLSATDTRDRFFIVETVVGLQAALRAPMDRWIAFLHPTQKALVEKTYNGPTKVTGSAGTGKTVVAMHRARHLARRGESVLLTTYVTTLCENIQHNLDKLCSSEELSKIKVSTVHKQALNLVRKAEPRIHPATDETIRELMKILHIRHAPSYPFDFLYSEWEQVLRLQGINSWAEYRKAKRTGRGRGLGVRERKQVWKVFGGVLEGLGNKNLLDWPGLCRRAEEMLKQGRVKSPYTGVIVDEVQDLKAPELRFLRALCSENLENFMVCGDAGQRIYPGGFSLSALGVEVRGRSTILRINYRTTEQIRRLADQMLGDSAEDMDGGKESRGGTRSLIRGPKPRLLALGNRSEEFQTNIDEIKRWRGQGLALEDVGVFARSGMRLEEFGKDLEEAGISWHRLSDKESSPKGKVQLGTMHRAKGLEFKAVLVFDCSDSVVPSLPRKMEDPQDREHALARELRLLYVAMTRARDELTVTWTGKASRFLAPLIEKDTGE